MKKLLPLIFVLLTLCGCQSEKNEYLISGIGFDTKDDKFLVSLEAVIINSENTEQELTVFTMLAHDVESAIRKMDQKSTQPLLLSHCGVIAIGETVGQKQLEEIYEFCYKQRDITLSAVVVKTDNAKELLSRKPISSVSVGYDVLGLLKTYSKSSGKNLKNRFFEVYHNKTSNLPKIILQKEGYFLEDY